MNASIEYTNYSYWKTIRHAYACGIELTPRCNFDCVHCYLQDCRNSSILTTEEVFSILDILYEKGLLFIYFTGGEIFTRKDFLDIYLYAKRKGFIIELLTNISLLNQQILDTFKRYPPATISISVYGASEETYEKVTKTQGSFEKVINALDAIKNAGLHFEIKFIGLKTNLDDFFKVKKIAEDYNVDFKHSFEVFPTIKGNSDPLDYMLTPEEIVNFEKNYAPTIDLWADRCNLTPVPPKQGESIMFACDIALSSFNIDCEGYMEPCNKMRLRKYKLLENGFDLIWNAFGQYKQLSAPRSYRCTHCEYRLICTPCPAENMLTTGKLDIPANHMCAIAKARNDEFKKEQYSQFKK